MYAINETTTILLTVLLTVFATLALVLRLLQADRGDTVRYRWHVDDYLCTAALILLYGSSSIICWGAAKGSMGGHSSPQDAEDWYTTAGPAWIILAKTFWVIFFLQPLQLGLIRLAILFLYRRFFARYRSFNIVSWTLIAIVTGWTIAFFIGLLFDCGSEFSANWGSLGEIAEQCPFGFLPTVIYTIMDACLDLFVLVLPIPWIFQLNLSITNKLSITGCFLLGSIATLAAFLRMTVFIQTGIPSQAMSRSSVMGLPIYDILGIVSTEVFWTMIESTVALIAVCLPAIRKVVAKSALGRALRMGPLSQVFRSFGSSKGTANSASMEEGRFSHGSDKLPLSETVELELVSR